ncbi:hypothetical protein [Arenibacter certesii]|nr:hypothetical protein [Arenibacter certesii]
MKINQIISVLLLTLFLTKFLVVDAKILSVVMQDDQIVYVNPFCKNNRDNSLASTKLISDTSPTETILMTVPCSTVFQLKSQQWEPIAQDLLHFTFNFELPFVDGLYYDRNYPPPRIA